MKISIELNSLKELEDLKKALGVNAVNELTVEPVQQFTPQAPQPVTSQIEQQPMPSAAQVFTPQAPAPQPVPTAAPQYTQDDLVRAAMPLMDAGKQQELVELLRSFNVFSLPELKKEQYGPFAAKLREMGANI